ncbi:hypothetical protein ACFLU3_00165 [Chloroflexota bacterium]
MQADIRKREILYMIPVMAIVLDWGSTVIATLRQGEFNEINPIARAMGLEGAICYAFGFALIIGVILFRWGIRFDINGNKRVILTDCIALVVTMQGFLAYLNNFGYLPITHLFGATLVFGLVTFLCASIASLTINRHILFQQKGSTLTDSA